MSIPCNNMKSDIADYVLGNLSQSQSKALTEHTTSCPNCREYLQALQDQNNLLTQFSSKLDGDMPSRQDAVINALNQSVMATRIKPTSMWRTIMKSRISRITAAAAVLVIIALSASQFGGSLDMATVALADITAAIENTIWMHSVSRDSTTDGDGLREQWIGFEAKITARKEPDGRVTFVSITQGKRYAYDPQTETITIDYVDEGDWASYQSSPLAMFEDMHRRVEQLGGTLTVTQGEYMQRQVQVQEAILPSQAGYYSSRLYVDPESKLLIAIESTATDLDGNVVRDAVGNFSFPQSGPSSIYDLGVPRDARIVSNLPESDFLQIWDKYRHNRIEATRECLAIVAHVSDSGVIGMIDVDYKSDRKHRHEHHLVRHTGDIISIDALPKHQEQLGDSADSLLALTQAHYDTQGHIAIRLYDGEYLLSTRRVDKGNWSKISKHYSPDRQCRLRDIGWPKIGHDSHLIEDDYATEKGLLCIERLQQGYIYSGNVSLPGRFLFYLDPERDYMCVRKVTEWRPQAEWQQDKNWLAEVDAENIHDGSIRVEDITEVAQAANGHWYPKTIEVSDTGIRPDYKEVPLRTSTIKRVYVETDPEFPAGIFDPNELPQ